MGETKEARIYRLRWWTLAAIAVSILVIVLDTTVMNIALPTIQRELNATSSDLLWMVNIYTMILGAFMITTGFLSDRFGRSKLLRIGLLVFGISSIGAFLSSNPLQLIIARVFMGTGAALIMPATLATITAVFPEKERGQAIGVWAGLNAIGIALGPIISGLLLDHYKWNSIFFINIPVVLVALVLCWFFVPDTKDENPHKIDFVGNVLSLAGLASLTYGLINGGSRGWTDAQVLGTLIGSVVLIILFILWEKRTTEPLLDLGFFRNSNFSIGIATLIIMGLALNGVSYVLTYYVQFIQGYSPLGAGLRFIPLAAGMLIGATTADRFVKRLGRKWVIATGFAGTAITLILTSFLKVGSPFWQWGTELFFVGSFLGIIVAPVTDIIMGSLPKSRAGIGSAVNTTFRMVAGTIGVAVLGSILSSIYKSNFINSLSAIPTIPTNITKVASDSVGAALGIAASGKLPAATATALAQTAKNSFMDGWSVIMIISGVIFTVGAVIVIRFVSSHQSASVKENKNHK